MYRLRNRCLQLSLGSLIFFFVSFNVVVFYFLMVNYDIGDPINGQYEIGNDSARHSPCSLDDNNRNFRSACPSEVPCLQKLDITQVDVSFGADDNLMDRRYPGGHPSAGVQQISREIHRFPGFLDSVHFFLVPLFARIQWKYGIYGTVAEFGVAYGKFTALLAQNIDTEAGERLFVADTFTSPASRKLSMMGRLTQYDIFAANLRKIGFEEMANAPKRINIHRGMMADFQMERLREWQLPQFRLISISVHTFNVSGLLHLFEISVCLLMDGGILVVDGIDNPKDISKRQAIVAQLAQFFSIYGGEAGLTPILLAGNKIFITWTKWKSSFLGHIKVAAETIHLRQDPVNHFSTFGEDLLRITY